MGKEIDRVYFSSDDFVQFQNRLEEQLSSLKQCLDKHSLACLPKSIGAEMEVYLINPEGRPWLGNDQLLDQAQDPQLAPELNRYNLEYNLTPYTVHQQPFFSLEEEIQKKLFDINQLAVPLGGRVVPIGILPTLKQTDFGTQFLTDRKRFHALVNQLIKQRGSQFKINIDGTNPLQFEMEDITLEGANTSFQVHYQIPQEEFVPLFNAIQLLTPLALALGANSPTLFGHRLWDETRIPLFKQSIDTRHLDQYHWNEPSRVTFGHGWLRQSPYELFSEAVHLYPPLLPIIENNDNSEALSELRLHQGTVWMWNRPIYEPANGGHLRIEMRALPSGPTAIDMVANAAFIIGVAEAIKPDIDELISALPFQAARYNFYRSAQHSLNTTLIWPNIKTSGCLELPISDIIMEYLPLAEAGLRQVGISSEETKHYLDVIEERITKRQNGALWQCNMLNTLHGKYSPKQVYHKMLEHYIDLSRQNIPVAQWQLDE